MASLSQRLRAFLASPQGRPLVEQGQRQLAEPENQRKLRQLLTKLQNRKLDPRLGTASGGHGPPPALRGERLGPG